jgi:hypothetical protein
MIGIAFKDSASNLHAALNFVHAKNCSHCILETLVCKNCTKCDCPPKNNFVTTGNKGGTLVFFKTEMVTDYLFVPLTSALLNLPKGKSLGRSKPATNS